MTTSGNARTRWTRLLGVFCVAFCAAALALPARAEPAGKVLTADGDVLVLRGSQILRLSRGAAVESGDQIHTGTDGKVLIVFTDSGLVWLRANSDFVVEEYSYAQGRGEMAFFSLLKGGARSLTGLIGRRTRSNFRLRVPVATIGIRGTDFSVVICQRDCRDSDGSTAARGLYGEVIQGRIAVTPLEDRLLEREFGAGEFFHLADERSTPTPLFLPPPFLRSTQDEQARFTERTGIVIAPLPPILGGPGAGPAARRVTWNPDHAADWGAWRNSDHSADRAARRNPDHSADRSARAADRPARSDNDGTDARPAEPAGARGALGYGSPPRE